MERETTDYVERLGRYEAQERARLEQAGAIKPRRPGRGKKKAKLMEKTASATDQDAGMLKRPGKPEGVWSETALNVSGVGQQPPLR